MCLQQEKVSCCFPHKKYRMFNEPVYIFGILFILSLMFFIQFSFLCLGAFPWKALRASSEKPDPSQLMSVCIKSVQRLIRDIVSLKWVLTHVSIAPSEDISAAARRLKPSSDTSTDPGWACLLVAWWKGTFAEARRCFTLWITTLLWWRCGVGATCVGL